MSAGGSQTYWEARKLVEQALRADPNTLELLFIPSVTALDDIGQWVLEAGLPAESIDRRTDRDGRRRGGRLLEQRAGSSEEELEAWLVEARIDGVGRR